MEKLDPYSTNNNDIDIHNTASTSTACQDYVLPSVPPKNLYFDRSRRSRSREPLNVESARRTIIIQSTDTNSIPFTVEGGSENSQIIYIGQVLCVELMGVIGYGDIVLSVDGTKIAGRVHSEVAAFLYARFDSGEEIHLEYLPSGTVPIDIREILRNPNWSSLQPMVRENVFLRVVPCTTRPHTADEIDRENYHFVSLRHFLELLRRGFFLEHTSYEGHLYGTPRPEVDVRHIDDNNYSITDTVESAKYNVGLSEMALQTDARGPLPHNWEAAYSENGEKYFIDHNTGTTQWEDPRDEAAGDSKSLTTTTSETSTPTTIAAAPVANGDNQDTVRLPPGWERVDDEVHGTFYVDHINKRTQYEPPPPFDESPAGAAVATTGTIAAKSNGDAMTNSTKNYYDHQQQYNNYSHHHQKQPQQQQRIEVGNGVIASTSSIHSNNVYDAEVRQYASNGYGSHVNGHYDSAIGWKMFNHNGSNGAESAPIWQRDTRQNGHADASFGRRPQHAYIPYIFTNDVNQLRGEIISTVIHKGANGLGFTLIGNDGSNSQPEFIQVKTILPNGPAARNGVLEPGDVLVFVNDEFMLGASQEDACCAFRAIPPGEPVRVQICRGYSYPASKIYTVATNFQNRSRDNIEVELTKGPKGFGFTITDSLQGQRVKTILFPDQCPNLMEGDLILEVNGQNVRTIAHVTLVEMLQNFRPGAQLRLLVSRHTGRHRSRTPTAGFRYGEQRPAVTTCAVAPRSKTPAPTSSAASVNGRANGANAAAINRNNVFQQQQLQQGRALGNYESIGQNWSTTMPKAIKADQPIYGDIRKFQPQSQGRPVSSYLPNSQMRSSSSTLGFSSTPSYMPASALAPSGVGQPSDWQYVVVNLIEKDGGFGFHLQSDEQSSPLIVGPIMPGGAAQLDGRLQPGDEIVEIDGQSATKFNYTTAVNAIKAATKIGHVKLVVKRRRVFSISVTEMNIYSTFGVGGTSPSSTLLNGANGFVADNWTIQRVGQQRGAHLQCVYDVHLAKLEHEDFGITIISQNNRYIGSIEPHSPAARCGLLQPGDCLAAINGYSVASMSHQQVTNFLQSSGNAVTLTIDPSLRKPAVLTASGDEIDSLVSKMATALPNSTLRGNGNGGTGNYGTLTRPPAPAVNGGDIGGLSKKTYLHVTLSRGSKGFGFSIRGGMEFSQISILVLRVADDGPAALDGRLRVGDQLVQINGENTVGMTHQRAIELITKDVTVQLVVARMT